jgi:hypothetical protein
MDSLESDSDEEEHVDGIPHAKGISYADGISNADVLSSRIKYIKLNRPMQ